MTLYLAVNQQNLPLVSGQQFSQSQLPGLSARSANGIVAVVSVNPSNPAVLGLKNLSTASWQAVMPSGSVKVIEPERTVRLEAGTNIIFGSYAAEIVAVAQQQRSYAQEPASSYQSTSVGSVPSNHAVSPYQSDTPSDALPWSSPKRWLPVVVGIGFLAGLLLFAIYSKSPSGPAIWPIPTMGGGGGTDPGQTPGGAVDDRELYRPLALDTSSSGSSTQWASSSYSYKNGVAPGDQFPVACAFTVTDGDGEVVKDLSKLEYWACRIDSPGADDYFPVTWSDGKTTSYKFYANKSGEVIGTDGDTASFEWYNGTHKGADIVVIKLGSGGETWIPGKVAE